jgi:hypothetical protein
VGVLLGVVLGLSLAGLATLVALLLGQRAAIAAARKELQAASDRAKSFEERLALLRKYEGLVDVEAAAAQMRDHAAVEARATTDLAQSEATALVRQAQDRASSLVSDAQAQVDARRAALADADAAAAVAAAEAKRLEQVAEAMRNVIDGYGDPMRPSIHPRVKIGRESGRPRRITPALAVTRTHGVPQALGVEDGAELRRPE